MANGIVQNSNSEWEFFNNLSITLGGNSFAKGYRNKKARLGLVSFNASNASGDGSIDISYLPSKYGGLYAALKGGGYLSIDGDLTAINIRGAESWGVGQIIYPLADQPCTEHYMATGTIKTAYTRGSFVVNTDMISESEIDVRQNGRVVTINGYAKTNGSQNTDGTTSNLIGFISDNIAKPPISMRILVGIAKNPYDMPEQVSYGNVYINGGIYFKTTLSGNKSVYFSTSYVV